MKSKELYIDHSNRISVLEAPQLFLELVQVKPINRTRRTLFSKGDQEPNICRAFRNHLQRWQNVAEERPSQQHSNQDFILGVVR